MATNEQTQKDTAKAKSRTFGRSKRTSKDTAKAKSRTFGRSKRAKEEEEEELLIQEEILRNNPMMQPTDLIGQQAPQEDVNPFALAGLGGAAAFQGMFPFASEPTASNIIGRNLPAGGVNPQVTGPVSQGLFQSSNIIGRNLPAGGANPQITGPVSQGSLRPVPNQPVLIGQPQSYQGVPTGPNTPPQFTGNAPARPIPGTQLAPPNQPPAVSSAGGAPANTARPMKAAQRVGPPATINSGTPQAKPSLMKNVASGLFKTGAIGALTTPNTMADATLGGAYERRVAAGEDPDQVRQSLGLASDYREIQPLSGADLELANQYAADYAAEQAGLETVASPPQNINTEFAGGAQMSRLGDEPLVFNAPTGPSSTAIRAAQIAATLPDDFGLMGAPGIQGTGIPTTTLNIDGGSVTVPQALADQTFQGIGSAPMSIEETRARLGGRTLNQYLNAPDGTEGVYGLRTDPQGRMIPAGTPGSLQTRADAYGDYEREAAAREGRLAARMQQPGETITERDTRLAGERTTGPRTYGGYTTAQLRDVVGGGDALRAAQMQAEMQGKQAEAEYLREQQVAAQEAAYKQQQKILDNNLKRAAEAAKPSTVQKAIDEVNSLIEEGTITQDQAKAAVLQRLKYDPEKLLRFDDVTGNGSTFTEEQESLIKKGMKKNPNYNREDIIKVLEEQGKL